MRINNSAAPTPEETSAIENSFTLLKSFFSSNPEYLPRIAGYPDDPFIWEQIFYFFYGDYPTDAEPELYNHPTKRRSGSTDPRWDDLLHTRKALRAMRRILTEAKDDFIPIFTPQEAA